MEMNLCLAFRPLTSATRQKDDLGFNRFYVEHSTLCGIDLGPNIERCRAVLPSPCVTVIPPFTYGGESNPKPCTHRLFRDPHVHLLAVN